MLQLLEGHNVLLFLVLEMFVVPLHLLVDHLFVSHQRDLFRLRLDHERLAIRQSSFAEQCRHFLLLRLHFDKGFNIWLLEGSWELV